MIASTTMSFAFIMIYCCLVGWAQWICVVGCQFHFFLCFFLVFVGPGGFLTVTEPFGLEASKYEAVFGKRPQCVSKNKREQGEYICLCLPVCMCETHTESHAGPVALVPKNTNGHFIVETNLQLTRTYKFELSWQILSLSFYINHAGINMCI